IVIAQIFAIFYINNKNIFSALNQCGIVRASARWSPRGGRGSGQKAAKGNEDRSGIKFPSRSSALVWMSFCERTLPARVHLFICFVAFCCSRRLPLHLYIQRIVFVTF